MIFVEREEDEILRIVEPIMDNCLNGSNEDNHAKHTRDFTERMRKIVNPENLRLQLSKKPRVFFTERKFIKLFRRQDSIGIIWKQFISTSNDELMNQAIFVERNEQIFIDHCMIC